MVDYAFCMVYLSLEDKMKNVMFLASILSGIILYLGTGSIIAGVAITAVTASIVAKTM